MSLADELMKLRELHQTGALSDSQYESAKARLISGAQSPVPPPLPSGAPVPPPVPGDVYHSPRAPLLQPLASQDLSGQTNQWAMFLHLSQLLGFFVPVAGLVAPIVIWQIKKKELPGIDVHGCHVVNWIITEIILLVVSIILIFLFIGIPLVIVLGVLGIVFPIIGAVKASNGQVWRYPLSIQFLTPREPVMAPVEAQQPFTGAAPQATDPNRPYGW